MSANHTNRPPAPPIFTPTETDRATLPMPTTFEAVAWAEYAFELEKRLGVFTEIPASAEARFWKRFNQKMEKP